MPFIRVHGRMDVVRMSKRLSFVLRHRLDSIGLEWGCGWSTGRPPHTCSGSRLTFEATGNDGSVTRSRFGGTRPNA